MGCGETLFYCQETAKSLTTHFLNHICPRSQARPVHLLENMTWSGLEHKVKFAPIAFPGETVQSFFPVPEARKQTGGWERRRIQYILTNCLGCHLRIYAPCTGNHLNILSVNGRMFHLWISCSMHLGISESSVKGWSGQTRGRHLWLQASG